MSLAVTSKFRHQYLSILKFDRTWKGRSFCACEPRRGEFEFCPPCRISLDGWHWLVLFDSYFLNFSAEVNLFQFKLFGFLLFLDASAMQCNAVLHCPNIITKAFDAITDADNSKSYCCHPKSSLVAYCCKKFIHPSKWIAVEFWTARDIDRLIDWLMWCSIWLCGVPFFTVKVTKYLIGLIDYLIICVADWLSGNRIFWGTGFFSCSFAFFQLNLFVFDCRRLDGLRRLFGWSGSQQVRRFKKWRGLQSEDFRQV